MGQLTNLHRLYKYDLLDLSAAFYRTAKNIYGSEQIHGIKKKRFLRIKKKMAVDIISIKTGLEEETKGILGVVKLGNLSCTFSVGAEGESVISACDVLGEEQEEVNTFLLAVEDSLKNESIYKGKAITITREFLDINRAADEKIIYGEIIKKELEAHLWGMIKHPEACIEAGIPPQRKILLAGPFGSGKTVTAIRTAELATAHGWTFIYLPPTLGNDASAITSINDFAQKYQPAIVFIEDIDCEQGHGNNYAHRKNLAAFDGVTSKGARIVTVMSTNHPGKISPAMKRPGRTDKIIDFGNYTVDDAVLLLKTIIPEGFRDKDINWDDIAMSCKDFMPAFVREVGTSAKLVAITSVEKNKKWHVTTDMIISAAKELRKQHEACQIEYEL